MVFVRCNFVFGVLCTVRSENLHLKMQKPNNFSQKTWWACKYFSDIQEKIL